jgi:hypothetical protein
MDKEFIKILHDFLLVERDLASRILKDYINDNKMSVEDKLKKTRESLINFGNINDQINYLNLYIQENMVKTNKEEKTNEENG